MDQLQSNRMAQVLKLSIYYDVWNLCDMIFERIEKIILYFEKYTLQIIFSLTIEVASPLWSHQIYELQFLTVITKCTLDINFQPCFW